MSSLDAGLLTLRTNMLNGDPKAFAVILKMMAGAGMIKLPQESEADVSISPEDQRMLEGVYARFGLAGLQAQETDHE